MEFAVKNFNEIILNLGRPEGKSFFIYRGQSNSDWKLIPKIARKPFSEFFSNSHFEKNVLESWKRYSVQYIDKTPVDDWDWLTLAQHYSLATRLLDWSKNPLIGLFFATHQNENTDAALYILSEPFSLNKEDIKDPFNIKEIRCFYPKGISARIINQRSVFTITPDPKIPIEDIVTSKELKKIIIPKNIISDVQKNLDFLGVNEMSVYPDLIGLSNYLNNLSINMV